MRSHRIVVPLSNLAAVYIVIAIGAFIVGLSKGGLGGALGSLVTPLFALVMPAQLAVGMGLPLLIVGDAFAVYAHWKRWDSRLIIALLPGSILGVILGSLLFSRISSIDLQHALGILALLYVAWKVWQRRNRQPPGESRKPEGWQPHVFGAGAGFASALANAGGPLITIYLLSLRLLPAAFVGTSALYFALINASKIPAYVSAHILTLDGIKVVAWAMPLVPFGVWSGVLLDRHIDMPTFEAIILIFLAVTGVALLVK